MSELLPPRVEGLDAYHKRAGRASRRRRVRGRLISAVALMCCLGALGFGSWVGYSIYVDQQDQREASAERRRAELQVERQDRTAEDILSEMDGQQRWRGVPPLGFTRDVPSIETVPPRRP